MALTPGASPVAPSSMKQAAAGSAAQQRGPPPGEKKVLTKAERREIQEAQRAAKETAKSQNAGGKGAASKAKQAMAAPAPGRKQIPSAPAKEEPPKPGTVAASELGTSDTLRIFSHFAMPKPVDALGAGIKGDIHPVIRRLGLQYAKFRIVGANARCIATLTAFKSVGAFAIRCF